MTRTLLRKSAAERPPRPAVGDTWNKLTIVAERRDAGGKVLVCRCECGSESEFPSAGLKTKISCGCLKPKVKDTRKNLVSEMLYRCAWRAKKYGRECDLTLDQVETLIFENCYYCGSKPASLHRTKTMRKRGEEGLPHNGIDRQNAFEGYHFLNCRTCCDRCNSAKMQMTAAEYVAHCARVVQHCETTPRSILD